MNNKKHNNPVSAWIFSKWFRSFASLLVVLSALISPTALAQMPVAHAGGNANSIYNYQNDIGVEINFDASASTDPDGNATIVRYLWFFKRDADPSDVGELVPPSPQPILKKAFTVPGIYTATLVVTDDTGLNSVARASVSIQDPASSSSGGGQTLFNTYCIGCHGDRATGVNALVKINLGPPPAGNGRGTDWQVIKAALTSPGGQMDMINQVNLLLSINSRGPLVDAELQSIANYIAGIPDPGGGGGSGGGTTTPTGASIFQSRCVFCHGVDGVGGDPASVSPPLVAGPGIMGVTANEILAAVGNGSMTSVTANSTEAGLVAGYLDLGNVTHPTTAPELFGAVCARCHGTNATGGSATAQHPGPGILGVTESEISVALGSGTMANVSVTSGEVTMLAGYLGDPMLRPATGTNQGQELFDGICSRCHGTNGWGGGVNAQIAGPGILGATAAEISGALGTGSMINVSANQTEIDAIVAYINTLQRPTTGPELYSMLCSRCHGESAWGGGANAAVPGPGILDVTADEITNALNNVNGSMAGISVSPDEITKIATDAIAKMIRPTTDVELFEGVCARCHGANGWGNNVNALIPGPGIMGVTATEISTAVGKNSMANVKAIVTPVVDEPGLLASYLKDVVLRPTQPKDMYSGMCARCHGEFAWGGGANALTPGPGIMGVSSAEITFAAGKNAMANVSLVGGEPGSLETYLASVTRPGSGDGINLYSGLCARCHGPQARGSESTAQHLSPGIRGVTSNEILIAINNGGTMANVVASAQERTDIATQILKFPEPTNDGALMYSSTCARCHGDTALGGNAAVAQSPGPGLRAVQLNEVSAARGRLTMSNITNPEVVTDAGAGSVTTFIDGLAKPNNGADLYNGYCARCHGADATGNPSALNNNNGGNIACSLAVDIQTAIEGVSEMSFLQGFVTSSTVQDDYQLISNYMNTPQMCP